MSETHETSVLVSILKDAYAKIFYKNWPVWLGGLLIGITSVITFAWERPWGVLGGLREWIDWSFYSLGIYTSHPYYSPHLSTSSILTFGLLWGAFASALLSKQFAIKIPPPFELIRGAVGGIFMGIGTTMAMGCNVGGFFSAVSALSLSGIAMMAGLIVGVFLEVHYFYWEVEHLRFKRGDGRPKKPKKGSIDWKRIQPCLGALAVLVAFAGAFIYRSYGIDSVSGYSYVKTGGLLISGLAFGIILHRSRFAFLQAFREPFASGNAEQSRGMAIAVIVSVLGFAALKSSGLRPEGAYVTSTFWVGSFVGGIIFGFGMPFAGGCGSGTCWRTAEGGIKQMIAVAFMGISNSLCKLFIESSETLTSVMGKRVFLPKYISYHWTVILIVMIMLLYYLVTSWNEKTRAFI
ncbi:MAG: YeeE/YedE thiosulfate transporter family protein [Thermodesulfovibrionia bacterium]|nr:YeeE/YedE thiosulfate transporter family protein [Thermodesulfovibrionia bacterium]